MRILRTRVIEPAKQGSTEMPYLQITLDEPFTNSQSTLAEPDEIKYIRDEGDVEGVRLVRWWILHKITYDSNRMPVPIGVYNTQWNEGDEPLVQVKVGEEWYYIALSRAKKLLRTFNLPWEMHVNEYMAEAGRVVFMPRPKLARCLEPYCSNRATKTVNNNSREWYLCDSHVRTFGQRMADQRRELTRR
jgi:hypothetical protein